jgi:RNA ligase (TIGR02306 family)
METSTHKVEVIQIDRIEKHPNADTLGVVNVFGGYPCIVRLQDWAEGDFAAYVPPDSLVPVDASVFAFLKERPDGKKDIGGKVYHLVRSIKLRKLPSLGLLIKLEGDGKYTVGENLAEHFGVLHYDPPQQGSQNPRQFLRKGYSEKAPFVNPPVYDLDALRRFNYVFTDGENVSVTEKIHGANARYVWEDRGFTEFGKGWLRVGDYHISWKGIKKLPTFVRYLHVGSRTVWKRFDPTWTSKGQMNDVWWDAILQNPRLVEYLSLTPGSIAYGEVYGKVQDLHYGLLNEVRLAIFDIKRPDGSFMDPDVFASTCALWDLPMVPIIEAVVPFYMDTMLSLAEGPSLVKGADHIREGIVVKPVRERFHPAIGRVALKLVGLSYYER